jgi:diguanylate cyclase (GGDEF)-like protein/PAS domain S-box-containing protein
MTSEDFNATHDQFTELRKQAEKRLAERDLRAMNVNSLEDAQRLITELQVHQIELEMQNDELRQTHEQLNVEREKYADLYNFAPVAYFIFDHRDIILDLNLAAAELLGNERKYLVERPITPYLTPDSLQTFVQHRQKALETRLSQTCELTIRRRDGAPAFVQVRTIALRADLKGTQLWRSVMTDITERKQAEEHLNYQAHILGSVSDAIIATDANLRIVSWNKPAELLYGWSAAEALGQHLDELCHTEFIGQTQAEAQAKLLAEKVWRGELRQRRRDGSTLWVTASVSMLEDAQGNFTGGVTINHNITERKRIENIIQARFRITEFAAEHALDELLQNALDELCVLTDSSIGFFHFVEPDQKTLTLQTWSTRTLQEFCTASGKGQHYDIEQAGVWVDCVREGHPVIHNDYANLPHLKGLPEGHAPVIREMVFPITRHQKIVAIIGVGNKALNYTEDDVVYASRLADLIWDITERKRAETALRESEERYRSIFYNSHAVTLLIEPETGQIMDANPAASAYYGYSREELTAMKISAINQLTREQVFEEMQKARAEQQRPFYFPHRLRSGEIRNVEVFSGPITIAGQSLLYSIVHDITERKQAEDALAKSREKLDSILSSMLDAVYSVDAKSFELLQTNAAITQIFGIPQEEFYADGTAYLKYIHPEDREIVDRSAKEIFEHGEGEWVYRIIRPDGETRWVSDRAKLIRDTDGNPLRVDCIFTDITERKRAEEQLKKLSLAVEQSQVSVIITDVNGTIEYVNPKFCKVTGYTLDEVQGENPRILKANGKTPEEYRELWETILAGREWHGEFHNQKKNGESFWESTIISPISDERGEITHFVAVKEDITERRKADESLRLYVKEIESLQEQLREQAIRDPLTGLYNRRYMQDAFAREFSRAEREGYPVSIIMLDMDELKNINDTYGHHIGDQAIQTLATHIQSMIRAEDIICRYASGDEFAVILNKTISTDALKRVEEWRKSLYECPMIVDGKSIAIKFTAGIAGFPMHGKSVDEVVNYADVALYRAKAQGRGRALVFEEAIAVEYYESQDKSTDSRRK